MLEMALAHLLEGCHVVEANEEHSNDVDLDIQLKFWNQLQSLQAASLPSSTGRLASVGLASSRADTAKLREMYRLSLKSSSWTAARVTQALGLLTT
jgi:hypothetical protein